MPRITTLVLLHKVKMWDRHRTKAHKDISRHIPMAIRNNFKDSPNRDSIRDNKPASSDHRSLHRIRHSKQPRHLRISHLHLTSNKHGRRQHLAQVSYSLAHMTLYQQHSKHTRSVLHLLPKRREPQLPQPILNNSSISNNGSPVHPNHSSNGRQCVLPALQLMRNFPARCPIRSVLRLRQLLGANIGYQHLFILNHNNLNHRSNLRLLSMYPHHPVRLPSSRSCRQAMASSNLQKTHRQSNPHPVHLKGLSIKLTNPHPPIRVDTVALQFLGELSARVVFP